MKLSINVVDKYGSTTYPTGNSNVCVYLNLKCWNGDREMSEYLLYTLHHIINIIIITELSVLSWSKCLRHNLFRTTNLLRVSFYILGLHTAPANFTERLACVEPKKQHPGQRNPRQTHPFAMKNCSLHAPISFLHIIIRHNTALWAHVEW